MAENDPEQGQRPEPAQDAPRPRMLDYRRAGEDPGISKFQVFGGIFISTVALMAAVFVGVLGSVAAESGWVGLIVIGGAVAGVITWSILAYRNQRLRGFAIGLWIGFGVTFLIEGLCFANLRL